ncbi:santalene synthase-like [Eucalyptus grandis]|uniref:santalene synthase-like n=1 Tax=Eucalyptus grandis TaxID=71139 RepID=UPI00192EC81A|nr:santalene synthase-like [Eucalyptus grandis]
MGGFKVPLVEDVKGPLSLYEASFHGLKGESLVDEANAFTCEHLNRLNLKGGIISSCINKKVSHALELPIHWRPNRLEARWFMDIYEEDPNMNSTLLEMAKLDYNVLQSIYQKEVSELARRWLELGIDEMGFSRDRLVGHYIWSAMMVHEPQFGFFRVLSTKIISMITLIDDVYDVFDTLEELELLMDFVERWDITDIDKLPLTIRTSFLALYNTTNNVGLGILKARGFNPIPYIWRMDEMLRGDTPKAVECYMNESGASREAAVEHVKDVVWENWKTMNEQAFGDRPFPGMEAFVGACLNLPRASHSLYRYEDGHGVPDRETKNIITSFLIQPAPMN